jgi:hypothetical protein
MILINLLPPELRRRHGGVSPMFMSVVGGGVAALLLVSLYAYVHWGRIPNALAIKAAKEDELAKKKAEAALVLALEAQIAEFKQRRNVIVGLLARKVYWARTIDDFATLLGGTWTVPGFDVRCLDLSISESGGGTADRTGDGEAMVSYNVSWKYKLVGKERQQAGDYIQSFFSTIKASPFWNQQGFTGKPEDSYKGDQPKQNADIQRVVIEGPLQWQRVKIIKDKTLAGR